MGGFFLILRPEWIYTLYMSRKKLYTIGRIASGVIAVAGVLATFFIFVYLPLYAGFIALVVTLGFVALTFYFRYLVRKEDEKENPPPPVGDYITGRVPLDLHEEDEDEPDKDSEETKD